MGVGPVAQAVSVRNFAEVVLLSNYAKPDAQAYVRWLRLRTAGSVRLEQCSLTGPTEFGEIYEVSVEVLDRILVRHRQGVELTFHLSSGNGPPTCRH